MGHDATKIQMGSTKSSSREVDNRAGDVTAFPAGTLVRLKSDGTISKAAADGGVLGLSVGKDLANAGRVAIVRKGLDVPIRLTASFVPVVGAQVFISDTTGLAGASGAGFTGMNAIYKTAALTLVEEDGTEVAARAAYIDMPGGL